MSKKAVLDPKFDEAIQWMKEAHGDQLRVFSGAPYWIHPLQVAILVMKFKKSHELDNLVLAALFHDMVEDTSFYAKHIEDRYGPLVASLVQEVTNDPYRIEEIGKTAYLCQKVLTLSDWGLVIKLCDRLANVSDFLFAPQSFIEKYEQETREILKVLNARNLTPTQTAICDHITKQLDLYHVERLFP